MRIPVPIQKLLGMKILYESIGQVEDCMKHLHSIL